MRASVTAGAVLAMIGFACALATPPAARAQDVDVTAPAPSDAADDANTPLTPEESAALERALTFDPAALAGSAPAKPLRLPGFANPAGLAVNRSDNPDGSSTVAVKQPLPDLDSLDANVGADVNLAAPRETVYAPGQPLPGRAASDSGSSATWASVGMANLASVDARADPTNDQGKLAGTLKHSVPLGNEFSVTLQDSYSVTETLSASTAPIAPAAPASPVTTTATPQSQVWGSQKSVKLDVHSTGTSFGAGFTTASNDPVTHNTFSADQKILGPLHVTTAVTDIGEPSESKSITAGFKLNW